MKWLVDAQLPPRLSFSLRTAGQDAIHTSDLPDGNRTPDAEINRISVSEERILITKDADFVESFHLQRRPYKLLLISTGNLSNAALDALLLPLLPDLVLAFENARLIEVTQTAWITYE